MAASVERRRRPVEPPGGGGVAHRRAPAEGEAQHELRPPGDPLGQRIGRHQQQRGRPPAPAPADAAAAGSAGWACTAPTRNTSACRSRHRAGGQRPAGGAGDPAVHVAVPHVVDHAAGRRASGRRRRRTARAARRCGPAGAPASRIDHSPGRNSSQAPIGRSKPGQQHDRAPARRGRRATQPPVTMSVWPGFAGSVADGHGC